MLSKAEWHRTQWGSSCLHFMDSRVHNKGREEYNARIWWMTTASLVPLLHSELLQALSRQRLLANHCSAPSTEISSFCSAEAKSPVLGLWNGEKEGEICYIGIYRALSATSKHAWRQELHEESVYSKVTLSCVNCKWRDTSNNLKQLLYFGIFKLVLFLSLKKLMHHQLLMYTIYSSLLSLLALGVKISLLQGHKEFWLVELLIW